MQYHYVAIDIDGTLLDDQDHYNYSRLQRDIQALRKRDVTLLIASGNSLDALQTNFGGLTDNYVAENGGRVVVNGQEIAGVPHQPETVTKVWDYLQRLPQPDLLSLSGDRHTLIPQTYVAVPVPYYPHHVYFKHLAEVQEPIYNINVNWYQQRLPLTQIQQIVQAINNTFAEVNATYSGAFGIDILPHGVDKAWGLARFVQHTGGSMEQVVAIGDTSNDLAMIAAAGHGLAMKNATPDLKKAADGVTDADNNHDGLLRAVEKIFSL